MTTGWKKSASIWFAALFLFSAIAAGGLSAAQPHVGEYALADVQRGARLFNTQCTGCHGNAGNQVPGVNLLSGRFSRAGSDEELAGLIRNGIPEVGMPQGDYGMDELTAFVAYLRSAPLDPTTSSDSAPLSIGDAKRGSALFHGKADCGGCHRVRGVGGFQGPNLSRIGAMRSGSALLASLLNPSAAIVPLNREIRAVTRDGGTITGRRLNEDTYSIQLMGEEGRLISLMKADLRDMTVLERSSMPPYGDRLTATELADIVAYLQSLNAVR